MASPTILANPVESSSQQPCPNATQSTSLAGPLRSKQDTSNVLMPSSNHVSHLQQYYQTEGEGFPEQVTKLPLSTTQSSTRKAYQSAWSCWSSWCTEGKINPVSAPLSKILEFLAKAFSDGLEHRSINVLRSAISSTHSKIDSFPVGQHPQVTKLMKKTELPPSETKVLTYLGCQEGDSTPNFLRKQQLSVPQAVVKETC